DGVVGRRDDRLRSHPEHDALPVGERDRLAERQIAGLGQGARQAGEVASVLGDRRDLNRLVAGDIDAEEEATAVGGPPRELRGAARRRKRYDVQIDGLGWGRWRARRRTEPADGVQATTRSRLRITRETPHEILTRARREEPGQLLPIATSGNGIREL